MDSRSHKIPIKSALKNNISAPAASEKADWLNEPQLKLVDDEKQHTTLITGGAGFIGTNLADALLSEGKSVIIYDNLSRNGVHKNLR